MFTAAARNPGLLVAALCFVDTDVGCTAAELAELLKACPSLTRLDMGVPLKLDAEKLEVLLTHGTNITSLTCAQAETATSFAGRSCKWQLLHICWCERSTVQLLAHLPLRTVQQLSFDDVMDSQCLGRLSLPINSMPAAHQLPIILRKATTNLAACPAWQSCPDPCISLLGDRGRGQDDIIVFDTQQRIQLLEALAPLGGTHVREFKADIRGTDFQWGQAEVQALAHSLNSKGVTTVKLGYCILTPGFWTALDEFLPSLQCLQLNSTTECSATDVAFFCCTRRKRFPFTLILAPQVHEEVHGNQLRDSLAARGMDHVEVGIMR
jgi:hypothetical protein